jgi:hypothetical protein
VGSSAPWGLKVSASDDLVGSNPSIFIDIANLLWKIDSDPPGAYQSMLKTPAESVIVSGQVAVPSRSFYFDYQLDVPGSTVSGSYSTTVVYTAYTE